MTADISTKCTQAIVSPDVLKAHQLQHNDQAAALL